MRIMYFGISSIISATVWIGQRLYYIRKARRTYYSLLYLQLTSSALLDILQYFLYCTNITYSKWVVLIILPTGLFNGFSSRLMKYNDTWTHEDQYVSWSIKIGRVFHDILQLKVCQIIELYDLMCLYLAFNQFERYNNCNWWMTSSVKST